MFAVGIEKKRAESHRLLKLAEEGEEVFKFLRGGYGCGKTFMARLALLEAQACGFATSFVVVSDNDLTFDQFDDVYRKVVQEPSTSACPRGALGGILDCWIARVEDALIAGGADEQAPTFDALVQQPRWRPCSSRPPPWCPASRPPGRLPSWTPTRSPSGPTRRSFSMTIWMPRVHT